MREPPRWFTAAAVATLVGASGGVALAQDAPRGDAAAGRRFYLATGCYLCHGRSGQGGALNGPAPTLAKTAMPFDGFKGQLRQPVSDMPAYNEALMSDRQIAAIYAFVKTCPGPLPTKDMTIFRD